jgi:CubicO group peptidase (beta-lactamase class C family)
MERDTIFKLASASKFITTIAVLQAVEKGLVGLDDDVSDHIPALASQEILTGFGWFGKPITQPRPQAKPITLRHLITQTAGTGYDFLQIQPIWRYKLWNRLPIGQGETVDERMAYPLLHEPGEGWTYGSGMTWAGKVLESASGMTLDEWVRKHIAEPLGLTSVTFYPDEAQEERLAALAQRAWWTGKVAHLDTPPDPENAMGGEGAYASMEDLLKILHSLLVDDEKLLSKKTTAEMFQPQLKNDKQRSGIHDCLGRPIWICNSILKKEEYDWGFGGVLIDGDSHEFLKKGTLMWSGLFHVLWVSWLNADGRAGRNADVTAVDRPRVWRVRRVRDADVAGGGQGGGPAHRTVPARGLPAAQCPEVKRKRPPSGQG